MGDILQTLQELIVQWGFGSGLAQVIARLAIILAVLVVAFLANVVGQKLILRALKAIFTKTETDWDNILLREGVFKQVSHLAPAVVIYSGAGLMFPTEVGMREFIHRVCIAYICLVTTIAVGSLLNAAEKIYQKYPISKERPIRAYIQVVKIIAYLLAIIFIIAILLSKSPWGLLSGLGAMTAIMMLVFKDTILGFVASIQLVANNMVRPGDWIEIPKYGADGDVIDVSINTVKVQNWDKTISTIPTYALISDSFKNWRGMQESAGRRIKRSVNIDMNSVHFLTAEEVSSFKKIHFLKSYIEERQAVIDAYNSEHQVDTSVVVNGRRMTNLGIFRAYIVSYLRNHPKIHQDMTFLVRHLSPSEMGLPIEIYVFSNDKAWANYESIQADIFDHLLAVIPEFHLRVFQNPTGFDFQQISS